MSLYPDMSSLFVFCLATDMSNNPCKVDEMPSVATTLLTFLNLNRISSAIEHRIKQWSPTFIDWCDALSNRTVPLCSNSLIVYEHRFSQHPNATFICGTSWFAVRAKSLNQIRSCLILERQTVTVEVVWGLNKRLYKCAAINLVYRSNIEWRVHKRFKLATLGHFQSNKARTASVSWLREDEIFKTFPWSRKWSFV